MATDHHAPQQRSKRGTTLLFLDLAILDFSGQLLLRLSRLQSERIQIGGLFGSQGDLEG